MAGGMETGLAGMGLAERAQEEMTAWDAMLKAAFRVAPYNPDDLMQLKGYDIYEQMMTDAMCRAAINTKRFALLAKPWQVVAKVENGAKQPTAKAQEARDFVESALRGMAGPDGESAGLSANAVRVDGGILSGLFGGGTGMARRDFGRVAGKYGLANIKIKSPKQTGFEVDDFLNVQAVTSWTPMQGLVTVPREKCVIYVYNARDELPYGDSDFRCVYKHWWSKDALVKFWNLSLQRFGMPLLFAQVGTSFGDTEQAEVLNTLEKMQQDASAVFPMHVKPELLYANAGNGEAFLNAMDWHNQQIAEGILLQTLTSGEGRRVGSMALGKVHFDILLYVLENAKADIEGVVNSQIVKRLVDYNFAEGEAICPEFRLGTVDERDFLTLAQAYDVLLKHGVVDGKEAAVRETFGLPVLE